MPTDPQALVALKPCPFCGKPPRICADTGYGYSRVYCPDDNECLVAPHADAEFDGNDCAPEEAARLWNTRTPPTPSGDAEAVASRLEAWVPLIASGYEVPVAAQTMQEAAAHIRASDAREAALREEVERTDAELQRTHEAYVAAFDRATTLERQLEEARAGLERIANASSAMDGGSIADCRRVASGTLASLSNQKDQSRG